MQGTLRLDNITEINQSEQLYYMYFEVNCKQKVIFIQYSQQVLYVYARRVLSIYTCMSFILRETRTTVREWACCLMSFFHKKNVTKFMGHHYAIWASGCNILLTQKKISGQPLRH